MTKLLKKYRALPVQVRASLWFLVCSFLQKGISMITTPIFTRIMTTGEYGDFGAYHSWYGIISIIVAMSLSAGVHSQGLIKYSEERNVFTSSLQGLSTTLVAAWLVIYLLFSSFWNNLFSLTTVQMVSMFVIIWITAVFGFWANEQRVSYSYRRLVIATLISSVMKPLLEIFLISRFEDKVTARIIGWMAADLAVFGWMFFFQLKKGKTFHSHRFWVYALTFNLPLVPHYLSQTVLSSSDRIMIQRMVGNSEAGIYNLAYSLSLIMTFFNTALIQTISPWLYQKIKDKKIRDIAPVAYLTLILIAAVNLLLILLAPEAVAIFAPRAYRDAVWVVPPVAMSVYFMYAYSLFAKFAFYHEKTKAVMVASVSGALLNIVLNYFCIQQFGYIAAGYTTLVCYIIYSVAHYLFMNKVCRDCCDNIRPYDLKKLLIISAVFVAAGFLILATYSHPAIRYSLMAIAAVILVIKRKQAAEAIRKLSRLKKAKQKPATQQEPETEQKPNTEYKPEAEHDQDTQHE